MFRSNLRRLSGLIRHLLNPLANIKIKWNKDPESITYICGNWGLNNSPSL